MAVIPLQFTYVPGIMSEAEYKRFLLEVASAGESGTASLTIAVQPNGWVKSSAGFMQNDTDELLKQEIEVDVVDGVLELEFGCNEYSPIEISGYFTLLSFTKDTGVAIFNEPFESASEINFETIVTPNYSWGVSILNTTNGTSFTVDNGFEFTLSRPLEYVSRGFYMYPLDYVAELASSHGTNLLLNINTTLIDESLGIEEDAYYGIWVIGLETDLWFDLRPASFFELSPYHGMLPEVSCANDQEDYQYQLLGEGEHSIDLSVFDTYLGGVIQDIVIEAFIKPLIG